MEVDAERGDGTVPLTASSCSRVSRPAAGSSHSLVVAEAEDPLAAVVAVTFVAVVGSLGLRGEQLETVVGAVGTREVRVNQVLAELLEVGVGVDEPGRTTRPPQSITSVSTPSRNSIS